VSIQTIMGTGLSALLANQQALRTVSTNVANVNTTGYSRLDVDFVSRQSVGGSGGVGVDVQRVANSYLAAAAMRGASEVASADVLAQFMDRAQGLLGDPSGQSSVFSALDRVFSSFGSLAVDPSAGPRQSTALSDLQNLLSQLDTTAGEISRLREEANGRIVSGLQEANALLSGIAKLNMTIQGARLAGGGAAEAENEQQRMLDRLAGIIDIRTQDRPLGGVDVRTSDGLLLADMDASVLGVSTTSQGEPYPGLVVNLPRSTTELALEPHISGGELKGLLRTRDRELVNLQLAFGEFAAGAAEALNAAHNSGTAVPSPGRLSGRNTGLLATDRLNFTGAANIAIVDSAGLVVRNFRVDFNTQQITDEAANVTAFANSIGDFQTALNAAMGADGQVTFANGRMQIAASAAGRGIAVRDDVSTPAARAGKGFSHTFGLNDLVAHGEPLSYATGVSGADLHGFTAGQGLTFALRNADGGIIRSVDFTVGAGATMASLRADIDAALQGYAQTSLNAEGRLQLVSSAASVARVDVLQDSTIRGDTGLSVSQIFGLGEVLPAQRARSLSINSSILSNPARLASAQADLAGAAAGRRVLSAGDGRAALALEAAGAASRTFAEAGLLSAQAASVSDYASRLAGQAGARAEALSAARQSAAAVRDEVQARRTGDEGVNLDEELVKMTTYQQAYAAASRLIQAARDLYDITLSMV